MESHSRGEAGKTCVVFSPDDPNAAGTLAKFLKIFDVFGIDLTHIESRSSTRGPGNENFSFFLIYAKTFASTGYEFMVECDAHANERLHDALEVLKEKCGYFQIISRAYQDDKKVADDEDIVPWFPRRIRELDRFANQILSYGAELNSDHPGFTDPVYRMRRKYFADIAYNYKYGETVSKSKIVERRRKQNCIENIGKSEKVE